MPSLTVTEEFIREAIRGLQYQRERIEHSIRLLEGLLRTAQQIEQEQEENEEPEITPENINPPLVSRPPQKRVLSEDARRRISEAQKRRWEKIKASLSASRAAS